MFLRASLYVLQSWERRLRTASSSVEPNWENRRDWNRAKRVVSQGSLLARRVHAL
jgi:hypothetical protein